MWKKRGSKSSIFKRDWLVCYSLKRHGSTCKREQHVTEYSISCFCIEHNLSNKNVVISLIPNVSNIFHDAHNKRHQWPTYDFSSYELIDWFEKIRKEKVYALTRKEKHESEMNARDILDFAGLMRQESGKTNKCSFFVVLSFAFSLPCEFFATNIKYLRGVYRKRKKKQWLVANMSRYTHFSYFDSEFFRKMPAIFDDLLFDDEDEIKKVCCML